MPSAYITLVATVPIFPLYIDNIYIHFNNNIFKINVMFILQFIKYNQYNITNT